MELDIFENVSNYIEQIKELKEVPFLELGTPVNMKKVCGYSFSFNAHLKLNNQIILRKTLQYACKINEIDDLKIEFTSGEEAHPAHYILGKNTLYIDESLLKSDYYHALYLLIHELAHHMIYINKELNEKVMNLSREFQEKYKIEKENNMLLPIELLANSINHYLLKDVKKEEEYFSSWIDKFIIERNKLF